MNFISFLAASIKHSTAGNSKRKGIPVHVAIIMDGNGRWANKKKLPRIAGHRTGSKVLKEIVIASIQLGIKYLTVYSFSSENWQRPKDEVSGLMNLFVETLNKELDTLNKNGVKLVLIGERQSIPLEVFKSFKNAEFKTKGNNKLVLNVALNYGSRQEVL